ncbi:hypothetical protein [Acetilactobacillus jinshanensis]|uniref:Uncharacterized protein n=1 Tax=Acetilactobacillus jinshanensis TaxID=1720083 RepID=A0A4P6ZL60_9LACO|nr:hypothetical protein [Acetilactobacillus jinshanensis]QBP18267.1 hypothetical protein ELX58_03755 [Acetilactobacillus jinshanensis]URL61132.1 hypothetical protein HGK75_03805 [uncultured bacterium]
MPYSYEFLNKLTIDLKKANPKHNNYFIVMPHNDGETITINCHISSNSLIALPTIDNHPFFWLKLRIVRSGVDHYVVTDDHYVYNHISSNWGLVKALVKKLPNKIQLAAEAHGYNARQPAVKTLYSDHTLKLNATGFKELVNGINWLLTLVKSIFAYQIAADNHYYIAI